MSRCSQEHFNQQHGEVLVDLLDRGNKTDDQPGQTKQLENYANREETSN